MAASLDPLDYQNQQDTSGSDAATTNSDLQDQFDGAGPPGALPMAQTDDGSQQSWGNPTSGDPTSAPAVPGAIGGALGQAQAYVQAAQARASAARAQIAQQKSQRDAYDPSKVTIDPSAPTYGVAPPEAPASPLSDFAQQVWTHTISGTAEPIVGAASQAASLLGADPDTVAYIEKQKAALASYATDQASKMSPTAQRAMQATFFPSKNPDGSDAPSVIGGKVSFSSYFGDALAAATPTLALAAVPAGVVGSAMTKLAIAAGATEATAATAATVAGTATTGTLFGTIDAGQAYNALTSGIDAASHTQMMQSPAYQHLYDTATQQGLAPADADTQAKQQTVQNLSLAYGAAHFATGAIAGAGVGTLLTKGIIGAAGSSLLRRMGIGAAEGAATMGAQGGVDNTLDQNAGIAAGTQKEFDASELASSISSGALGGAAFGAAGGGLHGGHVEVPAHATPGVSDDAAAALTQAIPQPGPDEDNPEAGGAMPSPTVRPSGPWPDPNQGVQQPAVWPHPTDPDAAPQAPGYQPPAPSAPPPPPPPPQALPTSFGQPMPEGASQPELPLQGGQAGPQPGPEQPVQQALPLEGGQNAQPQQPELPFDQAPVQHPPSAPTAETPQAELFPHAAADTASIQAAGPTGQTPTVDASTATIQAMSRADMIKELSDAGVPKKGLAALPLADLRDQVDAQREAAQPETPPEGQPGAEGDTTGADNTGPQEVDTDATGEPPAEPVATQPDATQAQEEQPQPSGEEAPVAPVASGAPDATQAVIAKSKRQLAKEAMAAPGEPTKGKAFVAPEVSADRDAVKALLKGKAPTLENIRAAVEQVKADKAAREAAAPAAPRGDAEPDFASQIAESEKGASVYDDGEGGVDREALQTGEATEGAESATAPSTATATNVGRRARALLDDVLRGDKTPMEAHEAFGTQAEKGRKRSPDLKDFPTYIQSRIRDATKPGMAEELLRRMNADGDNESKATREFRDETSPETVQQLQNIHREIVDPAGAAVDREARRQAARAKVRNNTMLRNIDRFSRGEPSLRPDPVGIARASSAFIRAANDDRVNGPLVRHLQDAEDAGRTTTLHDGLRALINNDATPAPMKRLAERIMSLTDKTTPLMTEAAAHENVYRVPTTPYQGAYFAGEGGGPGHIVMHAGVGGEAQTLLHEGIHAITRGLIEREQKDPKSKIVQLVRAMQREVQEQLTDERTATPTDNSVRPGLQDILNAIRDDVHGPHEFVSEMMTSPSLQAFAASRMPSEKFLATLRSLGFPEMNKGRSLWQRFTDFTRRALGLPTVASGSEASLFDHLMSHTTGIMDRAARAEDSYDRGVSDPVVRQAADPMLRSVGTMMRDEAARALEHVDPAGIADRFKRGLLASATLNDIVGWNRALFEPRVMNGESRLAIRGNPLDNFRASLEAIAHTSKALHDEYADRVNTLAAKLAGDDTLGKLMVDATTGDARLGGGPNDNAHLTTPEQQATLKDVQARYAKLSPEQQATYTQARDLYSEMYRRERAASLHAWIKTALPDATDDQAKAVTAALRNERSLQAFLKDDTAMSQEFGTAWSTSRSLVRGIAKVHAMGFVKGDYFPLRRNGDYVLRYGSTENGDYGVEHFENRSAANARYAELAAQKVDNLGGVTTKRQTSISSLRLGNQAVDELMRAMANSPHLSGVSDEAGNAVKELLLQHEANMQSSQLRRKGVAGASTDQARTMAQSFVGFASRMGHLEHGLERRQALQEMDLQVRDLESHPNEPGNDAVTAHSVLNEMKKRMATGDDTQSVVAGMARKLTNWSYLQSLMSFSHALTSSVETHMNSTALLGARHGVGAMGSLAKAMSDVGPRLLAKGAANTYKAMAKGLKSADWNLGDYARDQLISRGANAKSMTDLFSRADAAGLIDHTQDRELRRMANPSGTANTVVSKAAARFMDFNAAGAHAVDVANRAVVLKAAYDLELRKTGSHDQAVNYAIDTLRKTSPNYNLSNKSRLATPKGPLGGLAAPLMQFKAYGIHMYGVMSALAHESVTGPNKWENRKALAGVLATHAMMAGSLTLIADPLRYVMGAYDLATGASQPHDYENDARSFIAGAFGPTMGEVISRGLPHAVGIDINHRVGLADLLEIPGLDKFSKDSVMQMLGTAMTGATGENASTAMAAIPKLLNGDIVGGAKDMVPRVVRDVMKAIALNDQGVVDGRGNTLLPPSKISPWDAAVQAAGFQPSKVSEFREQRGAEMEAKEEQTQARMAVARAWVQASPSDKAGVVAQVSAYNAANPGATITVGQLLRMQQAQTRPPNASDAGVRTSRPNTPFINQAGAFANVPR